MDEILAEPIPGEEGASIEPATAPQALPHAPEQASFTGAMLGANAGPGALFPPTRGVQTAIGAGGGHLIGKTMQDLANDVPQSLNQIGQNLIEAGKQGLLAGSAEMAIPFGGAVIAAKAGGLSLRGAMESVAGSVAKKVGEYILPVKGTAVATTENLLRKQGGAGLTPGQMDPNEQSLTKTFENIAYHSWTGGPIKGAFEANERDLGQAVDQFAAQMDQLAPKDAEATLKAVIDGRIKQYWMQPADKAFDSLRARVPGNAINLNPQIKLLRDPNSKIGNLVVDGLKKLRELKPNQTQEIDGLISTLETPKTGTHTQSIGNLSLNQALYLKAELNRIAGRTSYAGTPEGDLMISAAARMNQSVDATIKAGLARRQTMTNDTKLVTDYDKANKFYAAAAEKYDGPLLNKVLDSIEKKPGSLARTLLPDNIPSEQEHLNILNAVKAAYGPRWNLEMIPLLSATLANRAYNQVEQRYSGNLLAKQLDKYGQTVLDAALGPKRGQQLMDFARALEQVSQRPKGTGSVAIQMATAGALAGGADYLVQGDVEKAVGSGVATVLLAPWMIGHILANPTWLNGMKTGLIQFNKTGTPPSAMMTVLRQAAVASRGGTVAQKLSVEPEPRKAVSETALPNKPRQLTAEAPPQTPRK